VLVFTRNILFSLIIWCSFSGLLAQQDSMSLLYSSTLNTYHRQAFDSSESLASRLKKLAITNKAITYQILANDMLGILASREQNNKKAFECYFEIVRLCTHDSLMKRKARAFNSLSSLYFDQRQFEEARDFLKQEIALRIQLNDSVKLANNYINLSTTYRSLKQPDSIKYFLQKAGIIALALNKEGLLANYFNQMGTYFFTLHQQTNLSPLLDSAAGYYNRAYHIWLKRNELRNLLKPISNLGYIYQQKKEFQKAITYFQKAEKIADSLNHEIEKYVIYANMAETYEDLGNYKESARYMRKLLELKDSIQKTELKEYAVELDKKFQLENKSKTILQQSLELEQKNNRINKQQKQIYLYSLVFLILLVIIVAALVYFNFNKRLHKKIEEAKEKFFVNIMHEIKTPLSMIQAPLKALKPKLTNEEDAYYLQMAEKNTHRLNELLMQMLEVSKIDSGDYSLNNSLGNPIELLMELTESFQKTALEKNIRLYCDMPAQTVSVYFDKDALQKAAGNLLSNAIKYTPSGGMAGIALNIEEKENELVLKLEVWDTGTGIPKAEQEKLFTRFFRSQKTASQAKGMGIGLSLVKDIVDAHNGQLWFSSEENKGSRFGFSFSLKTASKQSDAPIHNLSGVQNGQKLILLVEDDKDIATFLQNFLQQKKYQVIHAANGKLAQSVLKNTCPDIIITDLMMEEMDGLSFIKEIKKNKGLEHIPIIVLSAKTGAQTRMDVLNAGAQNFVAKPFIPEELFSILESQLALVNKLKKEIQEAIEPKGKGKPEDKFNSSHPYMQKLFKHIFEKLDHPDLNVEYLADALATNRSHFQRKVKSLSGFSPSELIKMIRLEKALEFLEAKKGNVTEVAYMCGFSSQSYFTKCFTEYFGKPPSQV